MTDPAQRAAAARVPPAQRAALLRWAADEISRRLVDEHPSAAPPARAWWAAVAELRALADEIASPLERPSRGVAPVPDPPGPAQHNREGRSP